MLTQDLENLKQAIAEIEQGKIGSHAAKIRYYAALVSRSAINSGLPRVTSCKWDLHEHEKELGA